MTHQPAPIRSLVGYTTHHRALIGIAVAALLLRLALVPLYAYLPNGYLDEGFWKYWMHAIHDDGVLNIFRSTDTDYVGYHWVLWAMAGVYGVVGGPYTQTSPSLHVLVKIPSLIFDVMLIIVVYAATQTLAADTVPALNSSDQAQDEDARRTKTRQIALVAAAVIAVQPAVVYDSAVWAQTDSAITVAMLASIALVARRRIAAGWIVWTLGFLVKPHPIIVVPVLLLLTMRLAGPRAFIRAALASVIILGAVLGPWVAHGDGLRILEVYKSLFIADYERLSSSAWNLWWFWDLWASHPVPGDAFVAGVPVSYRFVGEGLAAASGSLAALYVWQRPNLRDALIAASYLALAFYVVPVSTHDRYLYPFLALMLPVTMVERRWLPLYAALSATLFLNMFFSAPPVQSWAGRWLESPLSLVVAAANVGIFVGFTAVLAAHVVRRTRAPKAQLRPALHSRVTAEA